MKSIKMASKHMKKCSISPANRETQIKTTVRYYHIPIRMIKMKVTTQNLTKIKKQTSKLTSLIYWIYEKTRLNCKI